MSKPRIFVPQPIPEQAMARLDSIGTVTLFPHVDRRMPHRDVVAGVRDHEILYALGEIPYDREVLDAANALTLVAAMHVSAKFVDIPAATERGIPVTGIPNMIVRTTAELTFALLMATAWRVPEAERFLREDRWQQNQSMAFLTTRLYEKTVGIVGLGSVGSLVARKARGCDMNVIYTKRTRLSDAEEAELGVSYRDLRTLFAESDFVVLTPALTNDTKGMVGAELLSLMKPTAMLINTSRGLVLDETALEAALRSGRIAGAGLDVYEREIPEPDPGPRPGLLELPNVVLTPHIGSGARGTRVEMANRAVDNIEAFLRNERPPDVLNPEVYGETARHDERIG